MDETHLLHVRKRMEVVFGLVTFIKNFENEEVMINRRIKKSDILPKPKISEGVIFQEVLRLLDQRWVAVSDVDAITRKMGVPNNFLSIRIYILNQVMEAYRRIPEQYFNETDHRDNLMEAVQEALDDLIEEEEEEEEEEDDDDDDDDMEFDF
ncbi:MAG: TyeA family type III secretion system gatekeeper subunit [Endozoicomonadaceae bacterium]|nr:TyeA family type III secretion system gatekeeper subunit [Endozoicomonadaceae bacterium]